MKWLIIGVLLLSCSKAPVITDKVYDKHNFVCFITTTKDNNFHIVYDTTKYILIQQNNTLILKNK